VCFCLLVESLSEFVKACLPEAPITGDPFLEFAEGFRTKRIKALLSIRADLNETLLLQYAEMSRNPGLVDTDSIDNAIDGILTAPKHLDNAKARRIGQSLKNIRIHNHAYTL
jgi:hypothetical protein